MDSEINSELPKVRFGGRDFYVDLRAGQFRQVKFDGHWHSVSFELMEPQADYLQFYYDKKNSKAYHIRESGIPDTSQLVTLPPIRELDPIGWQVSIGLLSNKVHHRPVQDKPIKPLSASRIDFSKRRLPEIPIDGTIFLLDMRRYEFRQRDNPENSISFENFERGDRPISFKYDRITKNIAREDESAGGKSVITVKLPPLFVLDLVGWKYVMNNPWSRLKQGPGQIWKSKPSKTDPDACRDKPARQIRMDNNKGKKR